MSHQNVFSFLRKQITDINIMAKKGQSITNILTHETITWLATSKDTNGEFLQFGLLVQPSGMAATKHVHPNQDELFEIKRGELTLEVDDEIHHLKAGDTITVPKGTPHQWWNKSETDVVYMHLTFTPASVTEIFFEQFFGACNDGRNNEDGSYKFWQAMAGINYYDIYNAKPPIIVQKLLGAVLGPFARMAGFKRFDPRYSDPDDEKLLFKSGI